MSPTRPKDLRDGWTTGTCATAATKAALVGLIEGVIPDEIEVELPSGTRVSFTVEPRGQSGGHKDHPLGSEGHMGDDGFDQWVAAAVVKDAGDDPDCTNGAVVTAHVHWTDTDSAGAQAGGAEIPPKAELLPKVELRAGDGVGTVTRPGLGLEIGGPAINPVPRRMITSAVAELTDRPVVVTISVPGGQEMAKKTTNERLGILGGISILGTTGIVRPFSTAAFRASVAQQVDVAAACGEKHVILATGSRTEAAARRLFPDLDPVCFVEVGDYTGVALGRAGAGGVERVTMVAMAGKIAKLAAGVMMTHFHRSKIDNDLLARSALLARSSNAVLAAATETATVRHFYEVCVQNKETGPLSILCDQAARACEEHTRGRIQMQVWMVDFDGSSVIARG